LTVSAEFARELAWVFQTLTLRGMSGHLGPRVWSQARVATRRWPARSQIECRTPLRVGSVLDAEHHHVQNQGLGSRIAPGVLGAPLHDDVPWLHALLLPVRQT